MTAMRVGDLAHDAAVVGDEDAGEGEPLLQVHQQVDDLGLDRDGFVGEGGGEL